MKIRVFPVIILAMLTIVGFSQYSRNNIRRVFAQSSENAWSEPVNISHSGSTTNPSMVVDNNGGIHVVWEDEFAGTVYSTKVDNVWQSPEPIKFPFSPEVPVFMADQSGWIHAIWIDEVQTLLTSRVLSGNFGNPGAWDRPRNLADGVIAFDTTIDSIGGIHLLYLHTESDDIYPAGIYYRRSSNSGANWFIQELLYDSSYFRSLDIDDANLDITSSYSNGNVILYSVWDNRPRKQIYLRRSLDGGNSWTPDQIIAGPNPDLSDYLPYDIHVSSTYQEETLLFWKMGIPGSGCYQYFQKSTNAGETWGNPQYLLDDLSVCPADSQFWPSESGEIVILFFIKDKPYMVAWDGERWSTPQPQNPIDEFIDKELYTKVILDCHNISNDGKNIIYVVGCDIGEGGDIWITSRDIGVIESWFPAPTDWSPMVDISTSFEPYNSIELISDKAGILHNFFTQEGENDGESSNSSIYHQQKSGDLWNYPTPIINSSSGKIHDLATAVDHDGRLYLSWIDSENSSIAYSWAESEIAYNPSEWIEPQAITPKENRVFGQDILSLSGGSVVVIYSIGINEGRGLYLIRSNSFDDSWTEPREIFDGQDAMWEVVGKPSIIQLGNGSLHILLSRAILPSEGSSIGLYILSSDDLGKSWTQPNLISSGNIIWSEIESSGKNFINIIWQEVKEERPVIYHQLSKDSGITWIRPAGIYAPDTLQGYPAVTSRFSDNLHILFLSRKENGILELQQWIWDNISWSPGSEITLTGSDISIGTGLAAEITPSGNLNAIISRRIEESDRLVPNNILSYTNKYFEYPDGRIIPETIPTTQTTQISAANPVETQITPTETPFLQLPTDNIGESSEAGSIFSTTWGGVVFGGIISLILIVLGIVSQYFIKRRKNFR